MIATIRIRRGTVQVPRRSMPPKIAYSVSRSRSSGSSAGTTVGTTAGAGASGAGDVGQIGEQGLDVGGVVGRLRDRDPPFELVDVQRVVREVVGEPRDDALARLLRPPDQRAVRLGQAGGAVRVAHARSVAPGRVG